VNRKPPEQALHGQGRLRDDPHAVPDELLCQGRLLLKAEEGERGRARGDAQGGTRRALAIHPPGGEAGQHIRDSLSQRPEEVGRGAPGDEADQVPSQADRLPGAAAGGDGPGQAEEDGRRAGGVLPVEGWREVTNLIKAQSW